MLVMRAAGKYFGWSFAVTVSGLLLAFWRGLDGGIFRGAEYLAMAATIAVLEISLSFDNAVINAAKLEKMDLPWRRRFLTWGIIIAVFGMRFVFPIVVVSVFSGITCGSVVDLVLHNPDEYARHLRGANVGISSFGGAFLFMLFFEFMSDRSKTLHWIVPAEKFLRKFGKFKTAPAVATLVLLFAVQPFLDSGQRWVSAVSGVSGVAIHLLIHGISVKLGRMASGESAFAAKRAGLASFVYIEMIDASFSLDGVLGAFALTKDVVVIAIGLAIGAFFVRSLTVVLVEKKTLDKLLFLTHGAYWAIGALAAVMLAGTFCEVHETVTGFVGLALILAALRSSVKHDKTRA